MIRLLNGDRKNMATLQKIDELADLWNKTKDDTMFIDADGIHRLH